MYGKLLIRCKMELLTGLHIGGGSVFSAIGAVDSPVVRDAARGKPMVPGSSLKGKLRYLLAKSGADNYIAPSIDKEDQALSRLFGSAGNSRAGVNPKAARLQFSDCFIIEEAEASHGSQYTEVKFENTINRLTSVANPRQIERVLRGTCFDVRMAYDMEQENEIQKDFETIAHGMKLLCMDYLGGHGTRGYGKVRFTGFQVRLLDGECPVALDVLEDLLKDVEQYAVFSA